MATLASALVDTLVTNYLGDYTGGYFGDVLNDYLNGYINGHLSACLSGHPKWLPHSYYPSDPRCNSGGHPKDYHPSFCPSCYFSG